MCPKLLREHIAGDGLLVVDEHDVHRPIANVAEHIHALEIREPVCNCGKALREHIHADDLNGIQRISESELHGSVLQKVFLKIISLTAYPG